MAAQYLYNVYTQTILFSTILGRVCDEGEKSLIRDSMTICCSCMNLRCSERVKIGSVGMHSSERVSSSEEFVEVRLDMATALVGCCTLP